MRKGRPRHQPDGWNQCPGPSPGEARFGAGPAAQGHDSKVVAVEAAVELAVARTCLAEEACVGAALVAVDSLKPRG